MGGVRREKRKERFFFDLVLIAHLYLYIYTRIHCGLMRFIFRVTFFFFFERVGGGRRRRFDGSGIGGRGESWIMVQSKYCDLVDVLAIRKLPMYIYLYFTGSGFLAFHHER